MTAPLEILGRARDLHHKEAGIFQQAEPKALAAHLSSKRWELAPFRPPLMEETGREEAQELLKVAQKVSGWPWTWGWSRGKEEWGRGTAWDGERAPPAAPWLLPGAQTDERWIRAEGKRWLGEANSGQDLTSPTTNEIQSEIQWMTLESNLRHAREKKQVGIKDKSHGKGKSPMLEHRIYKKGVEQTAAISNP